MSTFSNPKRSRTDRELSDRIFELANQGLPRTDFLQEVSDLLIQFFDCDAMELWLEEAGTQARCETARRPKRAFRYRLIRGVKKKGGKIVPALQSDSRMETFCWDVLLGKIDGGAPPFPRNDVFWILDSLFPYPSMAVTPLRVGSRRIALLILKSERKEYFAAKDMAPCGRVAQNLGMALMNQRAQAALQERIKELTCLHRIAKVMERPETPLDEVLQAVAEALAPAWQYPDIASARIIFDQRIFAVPNF
ncbi:MAG: hypothetical protein H6Q44_1763, partial [Deltaproteobacteria bacterium]|nr:hypothetical protein [Deltaproteobacteria bacterium]